MAKTACHVHSDWSYDGRWALPAIAREFAARGYRVVLMSEHDRGFSEARWQEYQAACAAASDGRVLVVPGIEYSDPENLVHILVWGELPFLGENRATADLLDEVARRGGSAVLAHPSRKAAWRRYEAGWAARLAGIELWNRKTDGWRPSPDAPALLRASGLPAFAGLDFHDRRQLFPLAMEFDVGTAPDRAAVWRALRAGGGAASAFGVPVGRVSGSAAVCGTLGAAEWLRRQAARAWKRLRRPVR